MRNWGESFRYQRYEESKRGKFYTARNGTKAEYDKQVEEKRKQKGKNISNILKAEMECERHDKLKYGIIKYY